MNDKNIAASLMYYSCMRSFIFCIQQRVLHKNYVLSAVCECYIRILFSKFKKHWFSTKTVAFSQNKILLRPHFCNVFFFSAKLPHEIRLHEDGCGWRRRPQNRRLSAPRYHGTSAVWGTSRDWAYRRENREIDENAQMRFTRLHESLCSV